MKRNLLHALQANTSPISEVELKKFLISRHGSTTKENASSDSSALDDIGLAHLNIKEKAIVRHYVLKEGRVKRPADVIMSIKAMRNRENKGTLKALNAGKQKKKTFGF